VAARGGVSDREERLRIGKREEREGETTSLRETRHADARAATDYSRAHLVLKIFSPTARSPAGASANEAMASVFSSGLLFCGETSPSSLKSVCVCEEWKKCGVCVV
jgi:hypothetical protein